jgi:hypothetical protein
MSCETTRPTNNNPVADTIRFINRLQQASVPADNNTIRCNNLVLGETSQANTRPFILYLPNGEPFQLFTLSDSNLRVTPVFRVESANENSATLRALTYRYSPSSYNNRGAQDRIETDGFRRIDNNYDLTNFNQQELLSENLMATRTFCTVNINSFIAIQCLEDVYLKLDNR